MLRTFIKLVKCKPTAISSRRGASSLDTLSDISHHIAPDHYLEYLSSADFRAKFRTSFGCSRSFNGVPPRVPTNDHFEPVVHVEAWRDV